jgi:CubicO group peptidase (beta-lactamase class C family)
MTEDTIFDMASLTKCLATATAIMQLYEPARSPASTTPSRSTCPPSTHARPTARQGHLRMLLTHTSGEAPDVEPQGPLGPRRTRQGRRLPPRPHHALTGAPGTLRLLRHQLHPARRPRRNPQRPDRRRLRPRAHLQAARHDRHPLPAASPRPAARTSSSARPSLGTQPSPGTADSAVPPRHPGPSAALIPHRPHHPRRRRQPHHQPRLRHAHRGTVHDPTTRRMGGVAGHAGVFSTAHDISLYARPCSTSSSTTPAPSRSSSPRCNS